MNEPDKLLTPAQQLAQRVMTRLVDKGLLSDDLAAQIELKVAHGQMQMADWKLTFEKSLNFHKKR